MIFSRYGKFSGGIDLSREEDASLSAAIEPCPQLERLHVPLATGLTVSAEPVVKAGDEVSPGQLIARSGEGAANIFAPLAGKVTGLVDCTVIVAGQAVRSQAIELTDIAPCEAMVAKAESFDWRKIDTLALADKLALGSVTTCAGDFEPLEQWVRKVRTRRCDILIANAMENEPRQGGDHRILVERGKDVVRGLEIIRRLTGIRHSVLAIDKRRRREYRSAAGAARKFAMQFRPLSHKYPIGNDVVLARAITGRETPADGRCIDVRVAIINPAACLAAYEWIACGKHHTHRVVTVAGRNMYVPFGAICADLVRLVGADKPNEQADRRSLIYGGAMTGRLCADDVVVTPSTQSLFKIDPPSDLPQGCIRCGWCAGRCPARLNVSALNDAFELDRVELAEALGATACVGCGICTYVCPAGLPLAYRMRQLKWTIRNRQLLLAQSDEGVLT